MKPKGTGHIRWEDKMHEKGKTNKQKNKTKQKNKNKTKNLKHKFSHDDRQQP